MCTCIMSIKVSQYSSVATVISCNNCVKTIPFFCINTISHGYKITRTFITRIIILYSNRACTFCITTWHAYTGLQPNTRSVYSLHMRSDYTIEDGMFNLMTVFIESIGGADNTHA